MVRLASQHTTSGIDTGFCLKFQSINHFSSCFILLKAEVTIHFQCQHRGTSLFMKQKELSVVQRSEIVTWHRAGKSIKEISAITGWPKSTIQIMIQKWKQRGTLESRPRSGRPATVTAVMKKRIDNYVTKNDEAVSSEIVKALHLPVSATTVHSLKRELGTYPTEDSHQLFCIQKTRLPESNGAKNICKISFQI